jgi:hypothetical protein
MGKVCITQLLFYLLFFAVLMELCYGSAQPQDQRPYHSVSWSYTEPCEGSPLLDVYSGDLQEIGLPPFARSPLEDGREI